jgi:hypothetical protein
MIFESGRGGLRYGGLPYGPLAPVQSRPSCNNAQVAVMLEDQLPGKGFIFQAVTVRPGSITSEFEDPATVGKPDNSKMHLNGRLIVFPDRGLLRACWTLRFEKFLRGGKILK